MHCSQLAAVALPQATAPGGTGNGEAVRRVVAWGTGMSRWSSLTAGEAVHPAWG